MKRRIISIISILGTLLFLTGYTAENLRASAAESISSILKENLPDADSKATTAPAQNNQDLTGLDTSDFSGIFAKYQTVNDPSSGVPVMDALVPDGWTVNVECNWNFVSTQNPCVAAITFTSPASDAAIVFQTPHDYMESYDTSGFMPHQDRTDTNTYITYLQYRNAGEVLDLYFQGGILSYNGEIINETPIPNELSTYLTNIASAYAEDYVSGINSLGGSYGVTAQLMGSEGTASMRRYRCTGQDGKNYVADAFCCCIAAQFSSPSLWGGNDILTVWQVPFTLIFSAESESVLEKYKAESEAICNNSIFRPEFTHVKLSYGRYIRNMVMQNLTNKISAMTEAQASSFMDDYDDSQYTSDDWADDWSDYIYDQNEYTTTDGSTIKASTQYDSVYQNGDEFYFGPQGNAPSGWEELPKN